MEMTSSDVWVMAHAAQISLALALCSIAFGTILAVLLTPLAFARFAIARFAYRLYVFVVRGTPVLLLALLTFYALASYWGRISPYAAGVVVLTIYLSALFAEVFRGGVLAIPNPLWDSSKSLGLSRRSIFWRVVTPLVARYSLPPYLNVCVMAVKASSVLSIISVWELTFASREIIERTLDVYRVLAVASVFYFIMCFAIDRVGRWMEGRLAAKGFAGEPAVIEIRGIRKSYGGVEVLRGINLSISSGEILALIGRSGCGKTTLLRCINFLEEYDAGEIMLDGELLWYRQQAERAAAARIRKGAGTAATAHGSRLSTIQFVSPYDCPGECLSRPALRAKGSSGRGREARARTSFSGWIVRTA